MRITGFWPLRRVLVTRDVMCNSSIGKKQVNIKLRNGLMLPSEAVPLLKFRGGTLAYANFLSDRIITSKEEHRFSSEDSVPIRLGIVRYITQMLSSTAARWTESLTYLLCNMHVLHVLNPFSRVPACSKDILDSNLNSPSVNFSDTDLEAKWITTNVLSQQLLRPLSPYSGHNGQLSVKRWFLSVLFICKLPRWPLCFFAGTRTICIRRKLTA